MSVTPESKQRLSPAGSSRTCPLDAFRHRRRDRCGIETATTQSAGDRQANNGLLTAVFGHGSSNAISGMGHHCCSHVEIEASALPGSAKIPNTDAVQDTASASGEFRSLGEVANLAAGFDS